jgi:hypothetical protein
VRGGTCTATHPTHAASPPACRRSAPTRRCAGELRISTRRFERQCAERTRGTSRSGKVPRVTPRRFPAP